MNCEGFNPLILIHWILKRASKISIFDRVMALQRMAIFDAPSWIQKIICDVIETANLSSDVTHFEAKLESMRVENQPDSPIIFLIYIWQWKILMGTKYLSYTSQGYCKGLNQMKLVIGMRNWPLIRRWLGNTKLKKSYMKWPSFCDDICCISIQAITTKQICYPIPSIENKTVRHSLLVHVHMYMYIWCQFRR